MNTELLLFPLPDYGHYGCEILAWEACVERLHAELSALVHEWVADTWCYNAFRYDVLNHAEEVIAPDFPVYRMELKASIIARECKSPDGFFDSERRAGNRMAALIRRLALAINELGDAQRRRLQTLRAA